jgi:hypothetical protein
MSNALAGELEPNPGDWRVPAYIDKAQAAMGSRFGGAWVLPGGAKTVVHIGVVQPTPEDTLSLNALAPSSLAPVVTPVRYNYSELLGFSDSLSTVVDSIDPSRSIKDWGPVYSLNKLEVTMAPDPAVRLALQALLPADALFVREDAVASYGLFDTRASYPPYKAGRLIEDRATGKCTAAFAMYRPNDSMPYGGTTAGHCVRENDDIYGGNNDVYIGWVLSNAWNHNTRDDQWSDSAFYRFQSQGDVTNKLFLNPDYSRSVQSKYLNSHLVEGLHLCKSVVTTGVGCGKINKPYPHVFREEGFRLRNAACFEQRSDRGDSGGPIYGQLPNDGARAAGIVSGGGQMANGGFKTCFSPIQTVEDIHGIRLVTTNP